MAKSRSNRVTQLGNLKESGEFTTLDPFLETRQRRKRQKQYKEIETVRYRMSKTHRNLVVQLLDSAAQKTNMAQGIKLATTAAKKALFVLHGFIGSGEMNTPLNTHALTVVSSNVLLERMSSLAERIETAANINAIIFELSTDICLIFGAERLTLYLVDSSKQTITSLVKTGLHIASGIRLPISDRSIAGYCANHKQAINIQNVYDEAELKQISPSLKFRHEVDGKSGFKSRQMLVAPMLAEDGELMGVIQLINTSNGKAFNEQCEDALLVLANALGKSLAHQHDEPVSAYAKYEWLVTQNLIKQEELAQAVQSAKLRGMNLESLLLNDYRVEASDIGAALAHFYAMPYMPYSADYERPTQLLQQFPKAHAKKHRCLPWQKQNDLVVIIALDPPELIESGAIHQIFPSSQILYHVTTEREFDSLLQHFYNTEHPQAHPELLSHLEDTDFPPSEPMEEQVERKGPASQGELDKIINKIVAEAHRKHATHIHFEPRAGKEKMLIRLRLNDKVYEYTELPSIFRDSLNARLRAMAGQTNEKLKAGANVLQGTIQLGKFNGPEIEIRLNFIPVFGGLEDIIIELPIRVAPLQLAQLSLSPHNSKRLEKVLSQDNGLFIVCGPHGAGKTTVLHALINHIIAPGMKVWGVEEFIDIRQRGVRQIDVQLQAKGELDALNLIAHSDPNPSTILLGNIESSEVLSHCLERIRAGQTIFAGMYARTCLEAVGHLLDMSKGSYVLAHTMHGVLCQRFVKQLCPHCKQAHVASEEEVTILLDRYEEPWLDMKRYPMSRTNLHQYWLDNFADEQGNLNLFTPVGCDQCVDGYLGRLAVHELFINTSEVQTLLEKRASSVDILATAAMNGMRTFAQDYIEKALAGMTAFGIGN